MSSKKTSKKTETKKEQDKKQSDSEDLKSKIKEMESKKREEKKPKEDETVSFNSWYHKRKQLIPSQHMKEIVWADFQARGMKRHATVKEYDRALKMYGVDIDRQKK